jgi:hypothetical protein
MLVTVAVLTFMVTSVHAQTDCEGVGIAPRKMVVTRSHETAPSQSGLNGGGGGGGNDRN